MAYKALVNKYHPDRNPNCEKSLRTTQAINASYEVLSDPERKLQHDRWILEQNERYRRENQPRSNSPQTGSSPPPIPKPEKPVSPPTPSPAVPKQKKNGSNLSGCGCLVVLAVVALIVVFSVSNQSTSSTPKPKPNTVVSPTILHPSPDNVSKDITPTKRINASDIKDKYGNPIINASDIKDEDGNPIDKETQDALFRSVPIKIINASDIKDEDGNFIDKETQDALFRSVPIKIINASDIKDEDGNFIDKKTQDALFRSVPIKIINASDIKDEDGNFIDKETQDALFRSVPVIEIFESFTVEAPDGKEISVPYSVPTLTDEESASLDRGGEKPTPEMIKKALEYAVSEGVLKGRDGVHVRLPHQPRSWRDRDPQHTIPSR